MKSKLFLFFLLWEVDVNWGEWAHQKLIKIDKEGSGGSSLTKNWCTQIVGGPFVPSFWVRMLRDLPSGDARFKTFCHFIKITFTLFYFCPGNCVGTRENKRYRFYWKINFVERKYGDEVFPWNFKSLWKFILVDFKIDFCRYFQYPFFARMC